MVKNIIFDIGQVLVNYDWRGYIRSLGYEGETAERIGRAMFAAPDWNELDRGVLSQEEVRKALADDPDSGYANIDADALPPVPDPLMQQETDPLASTMEMGNGQTA